MPKSLRKRKHDEQDVEVMLPKSKFKQFDEEAEEDLSKILFGGASSFLQSLEEAEKEPVADNAAVDSGIGETDSDDSNKGRKPVWVDEDDGIDVGEALNTQDRKLPHGGINGRRKQYNNLLKHKFVSIVGTPAWAELDKKKEYSDSEDEVPSCGFIKKPQKLHLPANTIEFKKLKDLNCEMSNGTIINVIEFNKKCSVALIAGNKGVATLTAVDGKENTKLHSVAFQNFPIKTGKFIKDGDEMLLGSNQSHIYSFDLLAAKAIRLTLPQGLTQFKNFILSPCGKYIAVPGKFGEVHFLSSFSKEKLYTLKQDGEVGALAFDTKGSLLYGHSHTGEVTIWDLNSRRVRHKWFDDGCIQGTTIALSESNQVATGSAEGVVNLYDVETVLSKRTPQPTKTIYNITSQICDLKFNVSNEILAFNSKDSVKLLHVASKTVFSNFPNVGTLSTFSPGSGYLAVNQKSVVCLYRLKHYKTY